MEKASQRKRRVSVDDFLPPGDSSLSNEQQPQEESVAPKVKKGSGAGMPQSPKKEQPQLTPRGPVKRKSKFKTVIIIILVLGICAGGGLFGVKLFNEYIKPYIESQQNKDDEPVIDDNNGGNSSIDSGTNNAPNLTLEGGNSNDTTNQGTGELQPGTGTGNNLSPGLTDLETDTTMNQNSDVVEDTMVKDLRGISVIPNYAVQEIQTVTDMVNYEKHRAITDDGMELLWLEVTYKQKIYKVTVPFKLFKELDPTGITVVDMEVLNLANGSQIISYMEVREDYKSKLEKGLR